MPIKSPYNFAPAPEENAVFKPHWAKQVNQDIPFSDELSGTIDFTLTAATPVFIRNGTSRNEGNDKETHFSHRKTANGKEYFIPGSSIKGMVRNVLEILSSSRMSTADGTSAKDKVLFGLRDMQNKDYTGEIVNVAKSGWLKKVGDEWFIYPCKHQRIALDYLSKSLAGNASLKGLDGAEKSRLVGPDALKEVRTFRWVRDLKPAGACYEFGRGDNEIQGRIVLYGDIDNKRYDYIFMNSASKPIPVPKELFEKFIAMMEEIRSRLPKKEREKDNLWDFFRKNNFTEIPVFYKANVAGAKVEHFGFSKLYRLNNPQWLKDIRPFSSYPEDKPKADKEDYQPDLAELLFGYINKGKNPQSLKGRVTFGHAFSKNAQPEDQERIRILSSPRASFYPAYLKQEANGENLRGSYKTYHSTDVTARGFKRYPVHTSVKSDMDAGTNEMEVRFRPLKEGALFTGRLVYHNLKPAELGALLSAFTFHNNAGKCFHSLGMAKPYGFGKVKVALTLTYGHLQSMRAFEYEMRKHTGRTWVDSEPVKEVFAMSQSPKDDANKLLTYPTIDPENEFNDYKKKNLVLEPYSVRNGFKDGPLSLLDEPSKAKFREQDDECKAAEEVHEKQRDAFFQQQHDILEELNKRQTAVAATEKAETKKALTGALQGQDIAFASHRFEDIKKVCKGFTEKAKGFVFSEAQEGAIGRAIKECWKHDPAAFLKKKKVATFSDYPWTDIRKWVGDTNAQEIHTELTSGQ